MKKLYFGEDTGGDYGEDFKKSPRGGLSKESREAGFENNAHGSTSKQPTDTIQIVPNSQYTSQLQLRRSTV